jgi:hypothetical protein
LNQEVITAVGEGRFHIYPIADVDEGIEMLTGVTAGKINRKGEFPARSVHGRVSAKLQAYHQSYANDEHGENGKKPDNKDA